MIRKHHSFPSLCFGSHIWATLHPTSISQLRLWLWDISEGIDPWNITKKLWRVDYTENMILNRTNFLNLHTDIRWGIWRAYPINWFIDHVKESFNPTKLLYSMSFLLALRTNLNVSIVVPCEVQTCGKLKMLV
jgi:hypothetical protein